MKEAVQEGISQEASAKKLPGFIRGAIKIGRAVALVIFMYTRVISNPNSEKNLQ